MNAVFQAIQEELHFSFPQEITVFTKTDDAKMSVRFDGTALQICYRGLRDVFRAALICKTKGFSEPFTVSEGGNMDDIVYMADCSRNAVYTVPTVKKLLRNLAATGYTGLMLYIEDTYEVDGEPYFGYLRGRYSKEELRELDAYANAIGIELIPCMQTLGHLERITKYRVYRGYFDFDNILMVGEEKTYELIEKMFASLRSCMTTKKIHIGMDEASMLGLGAYLKKHGLRDRFDILTEHLQRVCALAQKYDFVPNMWSDMFFTLASKSQARLDGVLFDDTLELPQKLYDNLPESINLTYWEYSGSRADHYLGPIAIHQKMNRPVWYAGCSWKWGGMLPSNNYSIANLRGGIDACKQTGVRHIINTAWGDDGAETALFALLPSLVFFPQYANDCSEEQYKAEFLALTGYTFDDFMKLEYPDGYGKITGGAKHTAKLLLYNDVFLSMFDADLHPYEQNRLQSFADTAKLLREVPHGQYDYLFDFAATLSEAVYAKYDLGIRARAAYQAADRAAAGVVADDMDKAAEAVERLHSVFRKQWVTESKPHGFDAQDNRMGALMLRLRTCAGRLRAYANAEIDVIEELAEQLLVAPLTEGSPEETYFFPRHSKIHCMSNWS